MTWAGICVTTTSSRSPACCTTTAGTPAAFFVGHDLVLTPTLPIPPPPLGLLDTSNIEAMYTYAGAISALTSVWNITGQPAISLPTGRTPAGLPVGVQLVAALNREDVLLRVAAQVEAAQPWPTAPVRQEAAA